MLVSSSASERPALASWWKQLPRRLTPALRRWWLPFALLGLMAGATVLAYPHLRVWSHLRSARHESERCHNAQVIRHLRICREIWRRDPEILLLSARAARRAEVYDDSERLLTLYREQKGNDEAFAFEHLLLAAERRVDQTADLCWLHIEKGHPDTALLFEALTRGYLRQYRYGQARLCLDRWKQLQPNNPQGYYLEGLFFLDHLHTISAAADCYSRALELDPDHEEARLGLAVALLQGNSFAQAAQHFERLLQSQSHNARVEVGLAECRDGLGESAEAARLVDDVLTRQPHLAAALSLRGRLALKEGQRAEAEDWLRQALGRNPMDHRTRYSLILCLEQNGRDEEAQRQRRQLQQIEEDTARFHDIVTRDIAERPTDPALHCALGELLLRAGQREEGLRWLQSALHLNPNYAPARQAAEEYQKKAMSEARP